jgi:hypothetical protein
VKKEKSMGGNTGKIATENTAVSPFIYYSWNIHSPGLVIIDGSTSRVINLNSCNTSAEFC